MEANDYINVDSSAETGDSLSDCSILQLVHKRKATDNPLSDYEDRSTDIMSDDDDEPAEPFTAESLKQGIEWERTN